MHSCPNCGAAVADNDKDIETIICPSCGAEVDARVDFCPECGEPLYDDVEQPAAVPVSEEVIPVCTLRPLTYDGEKRAATRSFEDEGDGVSLSRGNTMPGDDSIDEELQANLFF